MAAKKKGQRRRPTERKWDGKIRAPLALMESKEGGSDNDPVVRLKDGTRVSGGLALLHTIHKADQNKLRKPWEKRGCKLSAREDRLMAQKLTDTFKSHGVKIAESDWHRFRDQVGWVGSRKNSVHLNNREERLRQRGYDPFCEKLGVELTKNTPEPKGDPEGLRPLDGYRYTGLPSLPAVVETEYMMGRPFHSPVRVFLDKAGQPEWVVATTHSPAGKPRLTVAGRVTRFEWFRREEE